MQDPVPHHGNTFLRSDLRARELELDRQVLTDPRVHAQRIHVELIKQLREQAPWLLPTIIN